MLALTGPPPRTFAAVAVLGRAEKWAVAGQSAELTLGGIDDTVGSTGSVLCAELSPIVTVTRFRARIVLFDPDVPITKVARLLVVGGRRAGG